MFDIGFSELVLVAVIALLVLGPERLPHAARSVGRWVGAARRLMNQVNQEIEKQIQLEEMREKLRKEGDTLGLEKIQQTVDEALKEARKFQHLVNQDISASQDSAGQNNAPSEPAAPKAPAGGLPEASAAGTPSGPPLANGNELPKSEPAKTEPESRIEQR